MIHESDLLVQAWYKRGGTSDKAPLVVGWDEVSSAAARMTSCFGGIVLTGPMTVYGTPVVKEDGTPWCWEEVKP